MHPLPGEFVVIGCFIPLAPNTPTSAYPWSSVKIRIIFGSCLLLPNSLGIDPQPGSVAAAVAAAVERQAVFRNSRLDRYFKCFVIMSSWMD